MLSTSLTISLSLTAAMALIFTGLFIRRYYWRNQEIDSAVNWYRRTHGKLTEREYDDVVRYIDQSMIAYRALAIIGWALLIFQIINFA